MTFYSYHKRTSKTSNQKQDVNRKYYCETSPQTRLGGFEEVGDV